MHYSIFPTFLSVVLLMLLPVLQPLHPSEKKNMEIFKCYSTSRLIHLWILEFQLENWRSREEPHYNFEPLCFDLTMLLSPDQTFVLIYRGEVNWLFNVTINDISVIYEGRPENNESCWISRKLWHLAYWNFTCLWYRPSHTFDTKMNAIAWRHAVWRHSDWRHRLWMRIWFFK